MNPGSPADDSTAGLPLLWTAARMEKCETCHAAEEQERRKELTEQMADRSEAYRAAYALLTKLEWNERPNPEDVLLLANFLITE